MKNKYKHIVFLNKDGSRSYMAVTLDYLSKLLKKKTDFVSYHIFNSESKALNFHSSLKTT